MKDKWVNPDIKANGQILASLIGWICITTALVYSRLHNCKYMYDCGSTRKTAVHLLKNITEESTQGFKDILDNSTWQWHKDTPCGFIATDFKRYLGIGNFMFKYASILGLAEKNKRVALVPYKCPLRNDFAISAPIGSLQDLNGLIDVVEESTCCKHDKHLENLQCGNNIMLIGYLQSWKYFQVIKRKILLEYTFQQNIHAQCTQFIKDIERQTTKKISKSCILVGVHVRQYRPRFLTDGRVSASRDYLIKALNHVRQKFFGECLQFVVLGNNMQWNLEHVPKAADIFIAKPGTAVLDLCILSHCNHTIMTVGTFGWWAAYLAGGYTTYQQRFAVSNSKFSKHFKPLDHFPYNWVPL